jgi:predicted transcriptional regulator
MKKKQLKDSTRDYDIIQKSKKILSVVGEHPEGCTPKQISTESGLNYNTVKSILPKIENIKKKFRGVYIVVNKGDGHNSSLTSWNFHNCILTYTLPHSHNTPQAEEIDLDLIKLKFGLSSKGKATLRVSTDYPLNISSLTLVCHKFQDLISSATDIVPNFNHIEVSTIEFNQDFNDLRLDGVKSITINTLIEHFKLYQKRRGLRLEHKTKIRFGAQDVVEMLKSNPSTLDLQLKLNKQKEQIDRLMLSTSTQTKLLFKVIDKLNARLET